MVNVIHPSLDGDKGISNKSASAELPALRDKGIYFLWSDIDDSSIKPVCEWILQHNFNDKNRPEFLTLVINSWGGALDSGLALVDFMEGSQIPIRTIGVGTIASCGLTIFMAGQKGERAVTPNTSILSHQYSWFRWGKQHELVASRKEEDNVQERLYRHYRKYTGFTDEQIKEKLLPASDVWLTAEEAKTLSLVDKIKMLGNNE